MVVDIINKPLYKVNGVEINNDYDMDALIGALDYLEEQFETEIKSKDFTKDLLNCIMESRHFRNSNSETVYSNFAFGEGYDFDEEDINSLEIQWMGENIDYIDAFNILNTKLKNKEYDFDETNVNVK